MNATLEDRLRAHYDSRTRDLPEHGPGLDSLNLLTIDRGASEHSPHRAARITLLIGATAAAIALAFIVIDRSNTDDISVGSTQGTTPSAESNVAVADDAEAPNPTETLPNTPDVSETPVTVAGTAPTDWYRLQPDLDVAWYQEPTGTSPSMLCWRTPAGSDCVPDDFPGALPVIAPTAGGQTLVLTKPNGAATQDVQLASGAVLSAPVEIDDQIGWGVSRYEVPQGDPITSVL